MVVARMESGMARLYMTYWSGIHTKRRHGDHKLRAGFEEIQNRQLKETTKDKKL